MRIFAAALLAVSVIVLITPTTLGSQARLGPTTTLKAPYSNVTQIHRNYGFSYGCSTMNVTTPSKFIRSTGIGKMGMRADSPACTNRVPTSYTYWGVGGGLGYGLSVVNSIAATTGLHNISINITVHLKATWNVQVPSCTKRYANHGGLCYESASFSVVGYPRLYTNKPFGYQRLNYTGWTLWNGTGLAHGGVGSSWLIVTCNKTACSTFRSAVPLSGNYSSSTNVIWTLHAALNGSRTYGVEFTFLIAADSESDHRTGAIMVGGATSMTTTLTFKLNSITIS